MYLINSCIFFHRTLVINQICGVMAYYCGSCIHLEGFRIQEFPLLMLWCMLRKVTEWRPLKGAQNRFTAWCWEPGIWTPQSAPPLKRPYKSYRTWDRRLFSVSLHVQCIYRYWQFLHLNNKCWNLKFNLLKFKYFFQ